MAKKTPKSKVISVRLPIEEQEAVEKAAVEAGTTVSAYVAQLLKTGGQSKPAPKPVAPLPEKQAPVIAMPLLADAVVLDELRRIGTNINQIARSANAGLPPDLAFFVRCMGQLLDALSDPAEFKRRLGLVKARFPTPPKVETSPPPAAKPIPTAPPPSVTPPRQVVPPHLVDQIQKALEERPAAPKQTVTQPEPSLNLSAYDLPPARSSAHVAPSPTRALAPPLRETKPPPMPEPPERPKRVDAPTRPVPLWPSAPSRPTPRPVSPTPAKSGLRHDHPNPQARDKLQDRPRLRSQRRRQEHPTPSRLGFLGKLWKW